MGENSKIGWTTHTFNCWRGCAKVSPGCTNCYAEILSKRNPAVLGKWGPRGTRVVAAEAGWRQVLKWDREAEASGDRPRVFCASLADVFEGWDGPMSDSQERVLYYNSAGTWWVNEPTMHGPIKMGFVRDRLFDLIRQTPNLDWLLLSKRPENFACFLPADWGDGYPNVWLGVTTENQEWADRRIPILLRTPAAVRFVSYEPAMEAVDFIRHVGTSRERSIRLPTCHGPHITQRVVAPSKLSWIICGGESGPNARPFDLAWARWARDQCAAAGVSYFLKQAGSNPYYERYSDALRYTEIVPVELRDSHGADESEFPEDLRGCRAFPTVGQGVTT